MSKPGYIAETEAAEISGMTARTLSRFAEAGYFQVERGSDNSYLYPREELLKLFGSHLAKQAKENDGDIVAQKPPESARVIPFPGEQDGARKSAPEVKIRIIQDEQKAGQAQALQSDVPDTKQATQEEVLEHVEANKTAIQESQEVQENAETGELSAPAEAFNPSIREQRLELITEMQEKLLLDREQRIQALEKEIQWLHTRLEKAEQKSDRDQVLLLQETQLLRQFLEQQTQERKSSLRVILEWMGIAPATVDGAKRKTIEMK